MLGQLLHILTFVGVFVLVLILHCSIDNISPALAKLKIWQVRVEGGQGCWRVLQNRQDFSSFKDISATV
jgi:hypothetical protein